jgi:hypothetical protein
MKKTSIIITLLLFFTLFSTVSTSAYFTDVDGNNHYGWNVVTSEENEASFIFSEDGNVTSILAAEGDTAVQWVNMYALRNLKLTADEEYSVEATFIPDVESDLSVERSYGIVAWYLDVDNYLIYWMQQKTAGDWSGQFYGRIDGIIKKYVTDIQQASDEDYWHSGEFNDMWWDDARYSHPTIKSVREALIDTTMTLKIVSKIETIEVDGTSWTGRSFELHQIIDEVDFVVSTYFVQGVQEKGDGFVTGLYSEAFNFDVEDFNLTAETNFALAVEEEIEELTDINARGDLQKTIDARVNYEALLGLKSEVPASTLTKLVDSEKSAATYIDKLIANLDKTKLTFVDDVNSVYDLYVGLSGEILTHVTKTSLLTTAVNDAKTWTAPNEEEPNEEDPKDEEPEKKGCFGEVGLNAYLMASVLILALGFVFIRRRRVNN